MRAIELVQDSERRCMICVLSRDRCSPSPVVFKLLVAFQLLETKKEEEGRKIDLHKSCSHATCECNMRTGDTGMKSGVTYFVPTETNLKTGSIPSAAGEK